MRAHFGIVYIAKAFSNNLVRNPVNAAFCSNDHPGRKCCSWLRLAFLACIRLMRRAAAEAASGSAPRRTPRVISLCQTLGPACRKHWVADVGAVICCLRACRKQWVADVWRCDLLLKQLFCSAQRIPHRFALLDAWTCVSGARSWITWVLYCCLAFHWACWRAWQAAAEDYAFRWPLRQAFSVRNS